MILPNKHIPAEQALIGVGSLLLEQLNRPQTVSSLWDQVKQEQSVGTYERFILGLDMLYILGLLAFKDGKIWKV